MTRSFLRLLAPVVFGLVGAIVPLSAHSAEPAPKPDTYLCPHATGGAVECFLHAVEHLYTMCRQVKSIEIIEYGYERSAEGTNGAKSEYCVDKHRISIVRPYQSALREATPSRSGVDGLRAMYDFWLNALAGLRWIPGESDDEYKARVAKPYEVFTERAGAVRTALAASKDKATTATGKGKATTATGKGKATTAAAVPPRAKSAN